MREYIENLRSPGNYKSTRLALLVPRILLISTAPDISIHIFDFFSIFWIDGGCSTITAHDKTCMFLYPTQHYIVKRLYSFREITRLFGQKCQKFTEKMRDLMGPSRDKTYPGTTPPFLGQNLSREEKFDRTIRSWDKSVPG